MGDDIELSKASMEEIQMDHERCIQIAALTVGVPYDRLVADYESVNYSALANQATRCQVLRENDELVCHSCGHRWGVGESDRECPRASVSPAQQILRELENG